MANVNPLCLKYTDENYVTKQGFFVALGSSLVERLWDNVVSYRLSVSSRTKLRTISQLPFTLTQSEGLKARYTTFGRLIDNVKAEMDSFNEAMGEEKAKAIKFAQLSCLKAAGELEDARVSEPTLRAMFTELYRPSGDPRETLLAGYRDFLQGKVGIDFPDCSTFCADVYGAISGTEELVTFYRISGNLSQGRAGEYAKYGDIESLVDNLEDFVANDPLDLLPKAFLSLYFVDYIQPFASHNGLLAIALAKKILAKRYGDFAYLLPLERLLIKGPKAKEMFLESAKTADFTYAMLYFIEALTPLLEGLLNEISRIRADALKREFRGQANEEPVPEPVAIEEIPAPVRATPEPVEAPVDPTPLREVEQTPEPTRIEEPKPAPKEEVAEIKKPAPVNEVPVIESFPVDPKAAFAPRLSINDKEVKMAARYIMETHPDINKQQALFFASHCTAGRYYTIQDYKKTMKVAYETARTSMDRLAIAKLYQKLRIKNKYVYTLRKAGEKE